MGYSRPVWAEINMSAIRHNMKQIMSLLKPETKFCPIIKADGYGHGAIPIAHEAEALGADYAGVAVLQEAIELRDAGITLPILILGYTPPTSSHLVIENKLTQTIYNEEQAKALSQAALDLNLQAKVHIKVDTGMSRIGVRANEATSFCQFVSALPNIEIEGIFTHFASADEKDKSSAHAQLEKFKKAIKAVEDKGINIAIKHCANSAGTLDLPEAHMDMVRAGIILYGLWPSDETTKPIDLKPVMKLKAKISMVKSLEAGAKISYGGTFQTKEESIIATLPLGYADGYTRRLSQKASILINGQRAPIVGRICMDQCMADVSGIANVKEGQEVLLFGGAELPADEIARLLDTINYEVTCMVGKRVPRLYIR